MKRPQSGTVDIVFVAFFCVMLLVGAYFLFVRLNGVDAPGISQGAPATVAHTDQTSSYTFSHPDYWVVREYAVECCDGEERDPNQPYNFLDLRPQDAHFGIKISFALNTEQSKSIDDVWNERTQDESSTYERVVVNGNQAMYQKTDMAEADGDEAYLDHTYTIFNNSRSLSVSFRQHHRGAADEVANFEAISYLNDFETILNTISFMN